MKSNLELNGAKIEYKYITSPEFIELMERIEEVFIKTHNTYLLFGAKRVENRLIEIVSIIENLSMIENGIQNKVLTEKDYSFWLEKLNKSLVELVGEDFGKQNNS